MVRSVRPKNTTFSWQVPTTEMELGPAAGNEARAALILVNAPGVAPLQSTTAPAARAETGNRLINRIPRTDFRPETHNFIAIFSLSKFLVGGKQRTTINAGGTGVYKKCVKTRWWKTQ